MLYSTSHRSTHIAIFIENKITQVAKNGIHLDTEVGWKKGKRQRVKLLPPLPCQLNPKPNPSGVRSVLPRFAGRRTGRQSFA